MRLLAGDGGNAGGLRVVQRGQRNGDPFRVLSGPYPDVTRLTFVGSKNEDLVALALLKC